jgi:Flp pilus assembly protein TadB
MIGLIYLIGFLCAAFIVYLLVEVVFVGARKGALNEAHEMAGATRQTRLQRALEPLGVPVKRYAPSGLVRTMAADLYWAQLTGKWIGWNSVQFVALRLVAGVGGFVFGMFTTQEMVASLVLAFVGWSFPAMSIGGAARKARRIFVSQLPEFIQLVSAQMAAGVSMEEAISRVSKTPGMVAGWMRDVITQAQGRDLIEQIQREAQESLLPELIGMSIQLAFIKRGTAQQELMGQLAMSIAADYIGGAERRAEKLGSEMIVPMILFYFVPFLIALLTVLLYPVMTNLFGA